MVPGGGCGGQGASHGGGLMKFHRVLVWWQSIEVVVVGLLCTGDKRRRDEDVDYSRAGLEEMRAAHFGLEL